MQKNTHKLYHMKTDLFDESRPEDRSRNLLLLKALIEKSINRPLDCTSDYIYLAGVIQGRLNKSLSVSTLKRIWGYVDGYSTIRLSTLDILAQTIGYADYITFVSDRCDSSQDSSLQSILSQSVPATEIPLDSLVKITWNPSRTLILRRVGDNAFEVVRSENSKITAGDTFCCSLFIINQPLFLYSYRHQGGEPGTFVVGNKGGLTSITPVKE